MSESHGFRAVIHRREPRILGNTGLAPGRGAASVDNRDGTGGNPEMGKIIFSVLHKDFYGFADYPDRDRNFFRK
jgi:hypothetical protein